MAYYTNYYLKVKNGNLSKDDAYEIAWRIHKELSYDVDIENKGDFIFKFEHTMYSPGKISDFELILMILNADLYLDSYTWYDHEYTMKEIAHDYPCVVFELTGCGEESDDEWQEIYVGDVCCRCNVIKEFEPISAEVAEAIKRLK